MNEIQVEFLNTIRAFLGQRAVEVSLRGEESWTQLYQLASSQAVFPMVYDVTRTSENFTDLSSALKERMRQEARNTMIHQMLRTDSFLRLYRKMLEEEMKVLVVKGAICRNIYPNPDARESGDEDLYVEQEHFSKVHDFFIAQGLKMQEGDDPKNSQVVTYFELKSGLHIELHRHLFAKDSMAYGHLNRAFEHVFHQASQVKVQGVPLWTMSPTEHLLYLVFHGFKHFLHSGFGIRQVCDVVLFAKTYGENVDWEWLLSQAKGFAADVFMMNLFEIGEKYLGVSLKEAHVPDPLAEEYQSLMDCEALLEDLLDAGVYGGSSMDRKHSSLITLNAVVSEGKQSTGTYAIKTLLPGVSSLKGRYTYLEKHPYLLPIAWFQRIWAYLRKQKGQEGGAMESIEIGTHRVELMKKYRIIR